jgi:hypothetical protein
MISKAKKNDAAKVILDMSRVKSVLMEQPDFLEPVVQAAVQSITGSGDGRVFTGGQT